MKKITALILSVVLVFSLAACSNTQQNDASDPVSSEAPSHAAESTPAEVTETEPPKAEDDTEPASSEPEETKGSNILIAYFTYGKMRSFPMTWTLLHQPVFKSLTVKSQAIRV